MVSFAANMRVFLETKAPSHLDPQLVRVSSKARCLASHAGRGGGRSGILGAGGNTCDGNMRLDVVPYGVGRGRDRFCLQKGDLV